MLQSGDNNRTAVYIGGKSFLRVVITTELLYTSEGSRASKRSNTLCSLWTDSIDVKEYCQMCPCSPCSEFLDVKE